MALGALKAQADKASRQSPFIATTERAGKTSSFAIVNKFAAWYRVLGFNGASSHSGKGVEFGGGWANK